MAASPSRIKPTTRLLPELELEVMKVLWRVESATVGEVQQELEPDRPLAYTTVMTVLDRLERKRVVTRQKQGRGYLYAPKLSRETAREAALSRLLRDFFSSSPDQLADFLGRRLRGRRLSYSAPAQNGSIDSALL